MIGSGIKVDIKIEKRSLDKLRRKMKQVTDDLGDAYFPNKRVGDWLLRWIEQNFSSEGEKVGGWKRFKYGGRQVTRKQSKRYRSINATDFRGFGLARINGRLVDTSAKLLQDTRRLHNSFWPYKATSKSVTIGSDVEYSQYHEYGVPVRGLPARRMLPKASDKEVQKAVLEIYEDYIEEVTGK